MTGKRWYYGVINAAISRLYDEHVKLLKCNPEAIFDGAAAHETNMFLIDFLLKMSTEEGWPAIESENSGSISECSQNIVDSHVVCIDSQRRIVYDITILQDLFHLAAARSELWENSYINHSTVPPI